MALHNTEVAAVFSEIADLLEIDGEKSVRVRAYRDIAHTLTELRTSLTKWVREGSDLCTLLGVAPDVALLIAEIVGSGSCSLLERLRDELPPWVSELLKLPGVGPRRVRRLHERLGVRSMEDLHHAARQGQVQQLRGFGEVIERRIAEATASHRPAAANDAPILRRRSRA